MLNSVSSAAPWLTLLAAVLGCGGDPVGRLVAQLADADIEVRRSAAKALGKQAAADDRIVSALGHAVADSDAEVRRLSIDALGARGKDASPSLPSLLAALNDREPRLRLGAALAIQRIDPGHPSATPVLVDAMRAGEGRILLAVGAMGADAPWAVPTLIGLLSHELPQVRALAAQTLGKVGSADGRTQAALRRSLRDPHVAVQSAAQAALDQVERETTGAGQ